MIQGDAERRFGGVARLYGTAGATRLREAHVCIAGIGGVGSWAAEALARTGIGRLTLIDLDIISESNTNRQLHALEDEYGKSKVEVMRDRIQKIHPGCLVETIDDYLTPENIASLLHPSLDFMLDAIDQAQVKTALIAHCRNVGIPIVTVGAAGGQIDPTCVRTEDLSRTTQDPLLAKIRGQLRKHHGFSRQPGTRFGIPAIFSTEPLRYPEKTGICEPGAALNCAGFGSSVCVTATFGFAAAAYVINQIVAKPRRPR